MTLEKEVILLTQSYREAKESGIVPELEAISIVEGYCDANLSESPFSDRVRDVAKDQLRNNARKIGADYVCGIDFHVYEREEMHSLLVYGDAYRKSSNYHGI